jgi:hypothetical protein
MDQEVKTFRSMAQSETPRIEYPFATKAGVFLAAVLGLWGVVEYFGFESSYQQQYRDPYLIAAQSVRLESFREAVAANAVLGYLTDVELGSVADDAMFQGAQYTLAPRLLERKTSDQQVLGNFTRPADFAALGRQHGLSIERDFGNGVVLYRGETR